MKRLKKYLLALALVTCLAVLLPNSAQAAKASIKLNKTKAIIYVGKSLQLKATVTGKSTRVTWRSSNKNIAIVTSKGKVTAKKVGKVRITAKANGKSKSCLVTVKKKSKPNKQTVQKAYKNYFNRNFKGNSMYRLCDYRLYDINKDGVSEMIISYESGVRYAYQLFAYKNGKVVKMHSGEFGGGCGVYGMNNKTICIHQTNGGAIGDTYTFYKVSGSRLKKVVTYVSEVIYNGSNISGVAHYKNKEKISREAFFNVIDKLQYENQIKFW